MLSPTDIRFEQFDSENPVVYQTLRTLALEWVGRTHKRIGMQALFERCRWQLEMEVEGEFKMNNTFAPYFARKLAIEEEDLRQAFEFRPSQANDWALDLIRRKEAG